MAFLGAHLSAAGGVARAAAAACRLDCEALQIFLAPPGRWMRAVPAEEEQRRFCAFASSAPLAGRCFAHAPYLLNLASDCKELRRRSVAALVEELTAADSLGLTGVVLHPGSAGRGSRREALARCREAMAEVLDKTGKGDTALLLEGLAGSGGQLGSSVRELAALVPPRGPGAVRSVGVCLDLAHLWAAGYDLHAGGWEIVLAELGEWWGVSAPHLLHGNDTPVECGSRKDRHAAPGEGVLGEKLFRSLLADPRLANTPLVLEIPPGRDNQLVASALARLRGWRGVTPPPRGATDGKRCGGRRRLKGS